MLPAPKGYKREHLPILIALNQSPILFYLLLPLAGAALTASHVAANTFLQERATNQNRGRIASLFQLSIHGGLSMGALLTGLTVTHLGVSKALFLNGVLAVLLQFINLCVR